MTLNINDTQHNNALPCAEYRNSECRYAEYFYAECRHAECRGAVPASTLQLIFKNVKILKKGFYRIVHRKEYSLMQFCSFTKLFGI